MYVPFLSELNNGTDGRPDSTLIAAVTAFGTALRAASIGAASWTWVQYSTKLGVATAVSQGFVDNEWDTQRRRGKRSTARTNWP